MHGDSISVLIQTRVQLWQKPPVRIQEKIINMEVVTIPATANRNSPNRMPPIFKKAATFANTFASVYLFLPASMDDYNMRE